MTATIEPLVGESPKEFRLRAVTKILETEPDGLSLDAIYKNFLELYPTIPATSSAMIRTIRLLEARDVISFEVDESDHRIKLWFLLGEE